MLLGPRSTHTHSTGVAFVTEAEVFAGPKTGADPAIIVVNNITSLSLKRAATIDFGRLPPADVIILHPPIWWRAFVPRLAIWYHGLIGQLLAIWWIGIFALPTWPRFPTSRKRIYPFISFE